jgi:hypothetical protein
MHLLSSISPGGVESCSRGCKPPERYGFVFRKPRRGDISFHVGNRSRYHPSGVSGHLTEPLTRGCAPGYTPWPLRGRQHLHNPRSPGLSVAGGQSSPVRARCEQSPRSKSTADKQDSRCEAHRATLRTRFRTSGSLPSAGRAGEGGSGITTCPRASPQSFSKWAEFQNTF